jgi:hypothetical protein
MLGLRLPYVLAVVIVQRGDNSCGNKERGEEGDAGMSREPAGDAFLDRLHELLARAIVPGPLMRSDLSPRCRSRNALGLFAWQNLDKKPLLFAEEIRVCQNWSGACQAHSISSRSALA